MQRFQSPKGVKQWLEIFGFVPWQFVLVSKSSPFAVISGCEAKVSSITSLSQEIFEQLETEEIVIDALEQLFTFRSTTGDQWVRAL